MMNEKTTLHAPFGVHHDLLTANKWTQWDSFKIITILINIFYITNKDKSDTKDRWR